MDNFEIDYKLGELSKNIKLIAALKPTNLNEEKEKFFQNPEYNPQFEYQKKNYSEIKKELKNLEISEKLFDEKRKELLKQIELIEFIGKEEFTQKSIELYGKPSEDIINLAKEELEKVEFEEELNNIETSEIKKRLEQHLKELDLDWEVILKDSLADEITAGKNGKIFLRNNIKVSEQRIQTMFKHEIDCHIIRAVNGLKQKYKIYNYGFPNYLETEEGLAIYMVSKLNLKTRKMYFPQIRVILVGLALKSSLSEMFKECLNYGFTEENAWNLCSRIKRGLKDTALPGCFTKDHIYYSGYLKIKKYLDKGKIEDLMIGKISLDFLD